MAATTDVFQIIAFYLQSVWYIWFSGSVLFGAASTWLWLERSDLKKYADDILIRKTCYKKKKTLGDITDMAGTTIEFLCDTDKDSPGLAKYKAHTLVNPDLVSTRQRGRLTNGIATLHYVLPYHFPMSIRDAAALIQTRDYVREHYPNLDWIGDDLDIIKLLFSNNKYLAEDCRNTVVAYIAMGVEIPEPDSDDFDDGPALPWDGYELDYADDELEGDKVDGDDDG